MWSSKLVAAAAVLAGMNGAALAANDPAAIQASPERGQSVDQARRDRYECHNWAVEQTGTAPQSFDGDEDRRDRRAERVGKVITGAGIGAAVGGIIRGNESNGRDAADGALGGAVLGAVIGAVVGREGRSGRTTEEDEAFDAYFRAISACLEGRGYEVVYDEEVEGV